MKQFAIASALCALLNAPAQAQPTLVNIAGMPLDQPPSGFEFARTGQGSPGQWRVVSDTSVQSGRTVAQTSQDATNYRFPLAIYQPIEEKNVEVTVRFKSISGKVDQAGGIAVRLTSPDDYYVARANALEDNVRFYRVVKGKREQIASADVKVAPNQWHELGLKADGDRFTVMFDGKELYAARDTTFARAGKIALWTKADSVTQFDALTISKVR